MVPATAPDPGSGYEYRIFSLEGSNGLPKISLPLSNISGLLSPLHLHPPRSYERAYEDPHFHKRAWVEEDPPRSW